MTKLVTEGALGSAFSKIKQALNEKSDTTHTHTELHTHANADVLNKITQSGTETSFDLSTLGDTSLAELTDVNLSNLADKQHLQYDNASGKWINVSINISEESYTGIYGHMVNVKDYGAKGDGSTDDTTAIQTALSMGEYIYFPVGTYLVNDTLNINNKTVFGADRSWTTIKATINDASKPIIGLGGRSCLHNLTLRFDSSLITGSETKNQRVGVYTSSTEAWLNRGGRIENVDIDTCGTCISDGGNGNFSTIFRNLNLCDFSFAGLLFESEIRTGNVYENIYMKTSYENVYAGFALSGEESECTIIQLNVEHSKMQYPIGFQNITGLDLRTCHIEGVELANADSGYIYCDYTSGNIGVVSVYYTHVTKANNSIVRIGNHKHVQNMDSGAPHLTVETIHAKGLNCPDATLYPDVAESDKTLATTNGQTFTLFNRDSTYTFENKYSVTLDKFVWETYYSDGSYYENMNYNGNDNIDLRITAEHITASEVNTLLADKADATHTHTIAQVENLQTALDGKADASHTHSIDEVDGLQTALDGKASASDLSNKPNYQLLTQAEYDALTTKDAATLYLIQEG